MEELKSKRLTLRPAVLNDKLKVYQWMTQSDLTCEMLGPPNFSDHPIPSWEEFEEDYFDYYFDDSQPLMGRSFIIVHDGLEIGQINYNSIDAQSNSTDLDIWLSERKYAGKGLGTEAIKIVYAYLENNFHCEVIYIAPSRRNVNAIKAYKKAGFIETPNITGNIILDYEDAVVLAKFKKVRD